MPLSGDTAEIRTVRRRMREVLEAEAWNEPDVDAILLSASEMVNNAFAHARPPYTIQATFDRDAVIEVRDGDRDGWPHLRATPPNEPGGKGLWILQALAAHWSTRTRPDGKAVCATFERHEGDDHARRSADAAVPASRRRSRPSGIDRNPASA
jgi:anti-sigma regulatory factor (Ser/Thr protein kinase)